MNKTYPTLYKRTTTGKIQMWYMEQSYDKFRSISGQTDGKKVTSEWTVCEHKNIGKLNATDPILQCTLEIEAKYRKQKDSGYKEQSNEVDNLSFKEPMRAHKYEDYQNEIKFPIFSQPKLDGIRCIVRKDGMWSRKGKPIISAPHIFNQLEPFFEQNPHLILDGELYADKLANDFNKIVSLCKKSKPTFEDLMESSNSIEYWVYDIASDPGIFSERNESLFRLKIDTLPSIKLLPTYTLYSHKDINEQLDCYLAEGYEGQMLRTDNKYQWKRTKYLLKHKIFVDDEFPIQGFIEGKGNLSNKIGKLTFITKDGVEFSAAVNGTHDYLAQLWKNRTRLIGKLATVKYFGITEDGSLRFPKVINIGRNEYE